MTHAASADCLKSRKNQKEKVFLFIHIINPEWHILFRPLLISVLSFSPTRKKRAPFHCYLLLLLSPVFVNLSRMHQSQLDPFDSCAIPIWVPLQHSFSKSFEFFFSLFFFFALLLFLLWYREMIYLQEKDSRDREDRGRQFKRKSRSRKKVFKLEVQRLSVIKEEEDSSNIVERTFVYSAWNRRQHQTFIEGKLTKGKKKVLCSRQILPLSWKLGTRPPILHFKKPTHRQTNCTV